MLFPLKSKTRITFAAILLSHRLYHPLHHLSSPIRWTVCKFAHSLELDNKRWKLFFLKDTTKGSKLLENDTLIFADG